MNREIVEDVISRLRSYGEAYPEKMFPKLPDHDRQMILKAFPGCIDRISADMGRHMAQRMAEMADQLEKALA